MKDNISDDDFNGIFLFPYNLDIVTVRKFFKCRKWI